MRNNSRNRKSCRMKTCITIKNKIIVLQAKLKITSSKKIMDCLAQFSTFPSSSALNKKAKSTAKKILENQGLKRKAKSDYENVFNQWIFGVFNVFKLLVTFFELIFQKQYS